MLNKTKAKILACGTIADLFGLDYFRSHIEEACESYLTDDCDDIDYEYFLGFDEYDDADENDYKWKIFARVSVNRQTRKVTFLDYKTPDGKRMKNPIKPINFA